MYWLSDNQERSIWESVSATVRDVVLAPEYIC